MNILPFGATLGPVVHVSAKCVWTDAEGKIRELAQTETYELPKLPGGTTEQLDAYMADVLDSYRDTGEALRLAAQHPGDDPDDPPGHAHPELPYPPGAPQGRQLAYAAESGPC